MLGWIGLVAALLFAQQLALHHPLVHLAAQGNAHPHALVAYATQQDTESTPEVGCDWCQLLAQLGHAAEAGAFVPPLLSDLAFEQSGASDGAVVQSWPPAQRNRGPPSAG